MIVFSRLLSRSLGLLTEHFNEIGQIVGPEGALFGSRSASDANKVTVQLKVLSLVRVLGPLDLGGTQ